MSTHTHDVVVTTSSGMGAVSAAAVRLAGALQTLAKGLPNPWDESTDFFHEFAVPMPMSMPLDSTTFRAALGIGSRYEIDIVPAADRLAALGSPAGGFAGDVAQGFAQLATVLGATLTDLSLAFARAKGVTRVRVWLFGRMADGTLVGLRSLSTES